MSNYRKGNILMFAAAIAFMFCVLMYAMGKASSAISGDDAGPEPSELDIQPQEETL